MRQTKATTLHNWDIGDLDENGYGESYELGWEGLPSEDKLPVAFEVDYVRV